MSKLRFLFDFFAPKLFLKLRVYRFLINSKDSFLWMTGFMESVRMIKPVDATGNAIPWMNYSFVDFLSKRLTKSMTVFEFGSGFSTLYFANLIGSICSVEYDKEWFDKINSELPSNAEILYKEADKNGEYCMTAINDGRLFDLIIVDGRDRVNCLIKSVNALKEDGVLILDDSHETKYNSAFFEMKKLGFKSITINGFKPFSNLLASSSIFYRHPNCLDI